ncbi:helix-turn-helix domain-containing protein [Bosea sp. ASV33]|uniref:helix-turn-helix domain-containing protein n=1 Tax=Bosea sp. ASV33 TaxID=2795106 RepID=UPI0018EC46A3|nr:helix-turn-helix domain-containing protein [Bosea sp. ASV33]
MSTPTPDWHAVAKQMHAEGARICEIARRLRKSRSTVRWAVDAGNERQQHRDRVRVQRQTIAPGIRRRVTRQPVPEPVAAPLVEIGTKPTLPKISLLAAAEPEPIVRKFAPRTRIRPASSGAERWRQIHRAMIRAGKLPEPGLPEQLHH